VVAHDPLLEPGPGLPPLLALPDLLSRCDMVSLHAPLTAQTKGLIGAAELAMMKPTAVLINTARGGLVDTGAVIEALRAGQIRAAALDVLGTEPPAPGQLPSLPGLLVTPHMAYYSEESIAESQRKAATQIIKVLTGGQPDYPVLPYPA
jgi:D-3-phosphoglycerate dehydrogenase / 2-oxoglutarate reductase